MIAESWNAALKAELPPKKTIRRRDVPWPVLGRDALHGLAGTIIERTLPHTEADESALLLTFLMMFGNCAGGTMYGMADGRRHAMNEFLVLVGDSSSGRKGVSYDRMLHLFTLVDRAWVDESIRSGLASGEGLIHAVKDGDDEDQSFRVQEKRLLVHQSEFATTLKVMGREGNTLSDTVRAAWDCSLLATMTKLPVVARGGYISIVAHITPHELRRFLNPVEASNGFANRFLFAMTKRSKFLPEGSGTVPYSTETLPPLRQAIEFARQHKDEVMRDRDARDLWALVYPRLLEGKPDPLGKIVTRGAPHVLRLSLMYAALDLSPRVTVPQLKAALAVWKYCEESAEYIFTESSGDSLVDKILAVITEAGKAGINQTGLRRALSNHVTAQTLKTELSSLIADRVIDAFEKPSSDDPDVITGRPCLLYRTLPEVTQ